MADWWLAGGAISGSNVKEHVENPNWGQDYAGGTLTNAWTIAVRTPWRSNNHDEHLFDSQSGRLVLGYANASNKGFFAGGWTNINLFQAADTVYFLVSDGANIQAYQNNTAVGSPVASGVNISGTTKWMLNSGMASQDHWPWPNEVIAGAVFDIALDSSQRLALIAAMNEILPLYRKQVLISSQSWVCPAGVNQVAVSAWGGGGAGSTGPAGALTQGGGGGSGGAYAYDVLDVTPGSSYTVTVGAAQGDSSFVGDSASVIADGGFNNPNLGNDVSGGQASSSTGSVKFSGGSGKAQSSTSGGGGGGSAGHSSDGSAGVVTAGGNGGTGSPSGARGGNGGTSGNAGVIGSVPGGGGGGAGGSNNTGGAGARGEIRLYWNAPVVSRKVHQYRQRRV